MKFKDDSEPAVGGVEDNRDDTDCGELVLGKQCRYRLGTAILVNDYTHPTAASVATVFNLRFWPFDRDSF